MGGTNGVWSKSIRQQSILAPASDPSINDWLNKKLGRSEFMPFAPVVELKIVMTISLILTCQSLPGLHDCNSALHK